MCSSGAHLNIGHSQPRIKLGGGRVYLNGVPAYTGLAAVERNIPFFHGAIYGFEGRAMTIIPGKTACLRCVYHGVVPGEKFPVMGVAPGVIGCIQATEVIKYIVGIGELLTNRFLIYDGLNLTFTELRVKKDPNCEDCGHVVRKK